MLLRARKQQVLRCAQDDKFKGYPLISRSPVYFGVGADPPVSFCSRSFSWLTIVAC
jgi:hypothetical protein